ncbi:MAG: High-affinity branched-chain amino acid transport system permease protein LivH [Rhodocyclaceae bacterium]|nr:High-affinity branched-chain amino acid transport system permease protein LivH [Rhodocyclaceae bacterium]
MEPTFVLIQLLNAAQQGLLLFLVASGLTLIFGVMGMINLAHGSLYMLGAYAVYALTALVGNFFIALALGVGAAAVFGWTLERLLFVHLYRRDHLSQVLATFGLILLFEELRSLIWGDDVHGLPVPAWLAGSIPLTDTLSYPVYRLAVSAVCLLLAGALFAGLQGTRLGMAIRAGSRDRILVAALGIDIARIQTCVFTLGVMLAMTAGMLAAPIESLAPHMGTRILIPSFIVVVLGGLGSVRGALVASLLLGVVDTFGQVWLPELAGAMVYLLMALTLFFRPAGLFARG